MKKKFVSFVCFCTLMLHAEAQLPIFRSYVERAPDNGSRILCKAPNLRFDLINTGVENINFYRRIAGIPPLTIDTNLCFLANEAAFLCAVNGKISHTPDPNWRCYNLMRKDVCGKSLLALRLKKMKLSEYFQCRIFVWDNGKDNLELGHRRMLISPAFSSVGYAMVGNVEAVLLRREELSTFIPLVQVAYPGNERIEKCHVNSRWSYSLFSSNDTIDISTAKVECFMEGKSVPVKIICKVDEIWDKTIGWEIRGFMKNGEIKNNFLNRSIDVCIKGVIVNGKEITIGYAVFIEG